MSDTPPLSQRYAELRECTRQLQGRSRIGAVDWFFYDRRGGEGEKPWPFLVVRIATDQGEIGVCQLPTWHRHNCVKPLCDKTTGLLLGRDPYDREGAWQAMRDAGIPVNLLSYADTALWDLHGRREDLPVHGLLGTVRERIRPYLSTPFNVGGADDYAADAVRAREAGYAGYKIHPNRVWQGPHDIELELAIYRAVREAIPDGMWLMSDPYVLHEYDTALRVGKVLDELDYYWYESPMPETDEYISQYVELKKHLRLPVIGGETSPGAHEKRIEWMEAGATDWGRLDIFNGGLTSCFLVAIECEKRGMPMDIHCAMHPHVQVFGATTDALIPFVEGYGVPLWDELGPDGTLPIPDDVGVADAPDVDFVKEHAMDWGVLEGETT